MSSWPPSGRKDKTTRDRKTTERLGRRLSTALDIYTKKLVLLLSIQTLETVSHVLLIEQKVAQNSCPTLPFWMAYDLEKYED